MQCLYEVRVTYNTITLAYCVIRAWYVYLYRYEDHNYANIIIHKDNKLLYVTISIIIVD